MKRLSFVVLLVGATALAQEIVPPEVVERTPAIAPVDALPPGGQALVVVGVTIEADGSLGALEVVQSGGAELDAAAEASVRQWKFKPALRGDTPIAAKIKVGIQFTSQPPNPAPPQPAASQPAAPPPSQPAPPAAPTPAAPAPESQPAAGETVLDATVRGRARPRSRGSSDYVQVVGQLADIPRKNATELLKLAPGFLLTNEGGEGHAEQIFLRGFDAREGQDIEVSVNGAVINEFGNLHGNGLVDLHFVIPELVESLRVVEGPYDPRQGNFAVAGSAEYELGLGKRGLTAKMTTGSFGTQRLVLLWGPPGESSHTYSAVELYQTDGFGQLRDARRGSAQAQYEGRLGDDGSFRLGTSFYTNTYHSPGVVREDDFESGKIGFYDSYDTSLHSATLQGGNATRFMLNADLELKRGDTTHHHLLYFTASSMQIRDNFTGFIEDAQTPEQTPHGQRGDLITLENTTYTIGGRGFVRKRAELLGHPQEVELGYFARADFVRSTQYRIEASSGHPYLDDVDLDSALSDIGLYADANLRPFGWLTLRGGVRADLLVFDVFNNCANKSIRQPSSTHPLGDVSCFDQEDLGRHVEPVRQVTASGLTIMTRATALVGPFAGLTFSGSFGLGVRSEGPVDIINDTQTPFAGISSEEGGASYEAKLDQLTANVRTAVFRTHVDKELAFSEQAGRNVLGGGTTRNGLAVSGRATGSFFDAAGSLTWVESKYDDTDLLVAYVPDLVVRFDGTLFGPIPYLPFLHGTLGTGVTYVGRRALPFGERSDTIFTIDTQATIGWSTYSVGVSVQNVLDNQYRLGEYNFTSNFSSSGLPPLVPTRHFTAGAPRTVLFTLEATL